MIKIRWDSWRGQTSPSPRFFASLTTKEWTNKFTLPFDHNIIISISQSALEYIQINKSETMVATIVPSAPDTALLTPKRSGEGKSFGGRPGFMQKLSRKPFLRSAPGITLAGAVQQHHASSSVSKKSPFKVSGHGSTKVSLVDILNQAQNLADDSQKRASSGRRSVHFDVDKEDNVRATVHTYERPPQAQHEHLYTSREEMKEMKKDSKAFALGYSAVHKEVLESLQRLFDSPLNRQGADSRLSESQAIDHLAQSEARGLEMRIFKTMMRHQRWAISSVVNRHRVLKQEEVDNTDEVLRSRSLQVSRCCEELALVLAKNDEAAARAIYAEG